MKIFWQLFYNLLLLPVLFILALFISLFNRKVKDALISRKGSIKKANNFFTKVKRYEIIYWFHCASHGEFEQVNPILNSLKEIHKGCLIVVSFSSPSGYKNVFNSNIDLKIYLPLDFLWNTKRLLKIIRPTKFIFAEYDLWPNYIWTARSLKIHTTLFSARFYKHSNKLWPLIRNFYKHVYSSVNSIYTISEKDHVYLKWLLIKRYEGIIRVLGSPRYDQVKDNSDSTEKNQNFTNLNQQFRLVAGSVSPEDDQIILDALIEITITNDQFFFTWVPHELDSKYINRILEKLNSADLNPQLFSKFGQKIVYSKCAVLDKIGYLSRHYWDAKVAYIGGGFSTGVHNLMEPAIASLPTIFGPKYHNSHAAEELVLLEGGFSIRTKNDFVEILKKLITDKKFFKKASVASEEVIHRNIGSSSRVVRGILRD